MSGFRITADKAPGRGVLDVYVNGILKGTVSLEATSLQTGVTVWRTTYLVRQTRTVLVVHRKATTTAFRASLVIT